MAKSMERLLELQECDLEIARIRREMDDIPKHKAQMESALDAQKARVAEADRALLEAQGRIRRAEGEIEEAHRQERKYREQQLQIKSNDEYRALESQIAALKTRVSALEDDELAAMDEVELLKAKAAAQKAELARQAERVDGEVKDYLSRAEGLGAELASLETDRAACAAEVDPDWLARYDRIASKGGPAVAIVEHGTCGRCHMKLSPAQAVQARRRDELAFCDFCGHILYSPT